MSESDREPIPTETESAQPLGAPQSPSEPPAAQPLTPSESPSEPPLSRREAERVARLEALTAAIAAAPDDPINYVLRGELRLSLGERAEAAEDFRRGLLLIAAIGETDWGYIHTALAERAQAGLRRCVQA